MTNKSKSKLQQGADRKNSPPVPAAHSAFMRYRIALSPGQSGGEGPEELDIDEVEMNSKSLQRVSAKFKDATDAELSDAALYEAYGVRTLAEVERRAANLRKAADAISVRFEYRRCLPSRRCCKLSCPICRRRYQLVLIAYAAPPLSVAVTEGRKQ